MLVPLSTTYNRNQKEAELEPDYMGGGGIERQRCSSCRGARAVVKFIESMHSYASPMPPYTWWHHPCAAKRLNPAPRDAMFLSKPSSLLRLAYLHLTTSGRLRFSQSRIPHEKSLESEVYFQRHDADPPRYASGTQTRADAGSRPDLSLCASLLVPDVNARPCGARAARR